MIVILPSKLWVAGSNPAGDAKSTGKQRVVRLRTVLTAVLIAIATMAASEQRRQPPLTKLQPQSLNPLRREIQRRLGSRSNHPAVVADVTGLSAGGFRSRSASGATSGSEDARVRRVGTDTGLRCHAPDQVCDATHHGSSRPAVLGPGACTGPANEGRCSRPATGTTLLRHGRASVGPRRRLSEVGDVEGRSCLIVDDMCDTGGSLTKVARALKENGAARIHACFTHPVLSGRACDKLADSDIEQMVVTNTIPLHDGACDLENIQVLSIAPLLAKAIKSIHEETSVSSLFV